MLPKGQYDIGEMPRFGLTQFAHRFPQYPHTPEISISGDVRQKVILGQDLAALPRSQITADFHCVTTWSSLALRWEGVLFKDVYEQFIQPRAMPAKDADFVILKGQDGARTSLPLWDLLRDNVILADHMNGAPLTIEHGAPLRLVVPDHYGYKSVKYLNRISLHSANPGYRPSGFRFMEHPRARVAHEERGQFFPGWLLRYAYKPLVNPTKRLFARALVQNNS